MVAIASHVPSVAARGRGLGWTFAAVGVIVIGLGLRLALGGSGVGDRSAALMAAILATGCWLAGRLLGGPRTAVIVASGVVLLFDLAALPARKPAVYDDLQAFYRADQVLTAQLAVPAGVGQAVEPVVTVLAQPIFAGVQPGFGVVGEVNGEALQWSCAYQRGIQRVALPVPSEAVRGAATADVRLHLSGSPSRDGDYLVVYLSSQRGGFIISLDSAPAPDQSVTRCQLT